MQEPTQVGQLWWLVLECRRGRDRPEERPARHDRLEEEHIRVVNMAQQPADELAVVGKRIHAE
jgi:hypothetical protein